MPPKPSKTAQPSIPPSDFESHAFPTAKDFENFLEQHHKTLPGIYLKLAKKTSGILSITASEAVETALCFGWIDGRANSIDSTWWTVRYTPRRAKSIWSQKNVETISRLIEEGRMREPGMEVVEAAKRDGRWERAYAGQATMAVPEDFERALMKDRDAKRVWKAMGKAQRYPILFRLQTGAVKSREKRIASLVEGLKEGKVQGPDLGEEKGDKKKLEKKETRKRKEKVRLAAEEGANVRVPKREGLRRRG